MRLNNRGFAVLPLVYICLGLFGLWQVKTILKPSKPTTQVVQLDNSAELAKQEAIAANKSAAEAKAATAAAVLAHQKEMEAAKAKEQAAAGFVAGADMSLAGEANPSINVRVAKIMVADAGRTLDPATSEQIKQMSAIIKELIDANATTSAKLIQAEGAALLSKQQAADATAKAAEADSVAKAKTTEAKDATAKVAVLTTDVAEKSAGLRKWAEDNTSLLQRITALAILSGLLLTGLGFVYVKFRGAANSAKDAAAFAVDLKTKAVAVASKIEGVTEEDLASFTAGIEAHAASWWADDPKAKTAFEAIKAKLRL
jgi:hypothetical protein